MLLIWRGMDAAASVVVNTGARQHLKAASVSLRAKLVNVTLALDLTRFLRKETEYVPWEAATRNLRYFVLMFQHTEAFGPLQACVTNPAQPPPYPRPKSTPKKLWHEAASSCRRTCGTKWRTCTTSTATSPTTVPSPTSRPHSKHSAIRPISRITWLFRIIFKQWASNIFGRFSSWQQIPFANSEHVLTAQGDKQAEMCYWSSGFLFVMLKIRSWKIETIIIRIIGDCVMKQKVSGSISSMDNCILVVVNGARTPLKHLNLYFHAASLI